MMAHAELHGQRVRLRDFCQEDIDDVFSYASDPLVTQFAGSGTDGYEIPPHTHPKVEHVTDRCVIGVVDIRVVSRLWALGEIGYTLARPYWGQGYNVEAGRLVLDYGFRTLGLRRIQAVCDTANRRSYRTMEKLCMVREQIVFGERRGDGRTADRFVYSILRREWERLVREGRFGSPVFPA